MTETTLAGPWRGIYPPMITPLCDRDTLDVAGVEKLIERLITGGVHGIFILGTTGEAPSLSYRLRRELIDRTCRAVGGRVPVLVGVTDTAFVESVNLARHAATAGATAVVLASPYYFPAGQDELVEYVRHLVVELPLPVFLYNMPMMTKTVIEPDTVCRLLDLTRVMGIKDSSGDLAYFDQLLVIARARPDWSVLVGPEHLLAETIKRGGSGGINGGANLWPRLFVDLFAAATRGDQARVAELQKKVEQLGALYRVGHHASAVIKGLKCALSLLGVCSDFMEEPFHRFRAPERQQVQEILEQLELMK